MCTHTHSPVSLLLNQASFRICQQDTLSYKKKKKKRSLSLAFLMVAQHVRHTPLTYAWMDRSCKPQFHHSCHSILQLLIWHHVVPPYGRLGVGDPSKPFHPARPIGIMACGWVLHPSLHLPPYLHFQLLPQLATPASPPIFCLSLAAIVSPGGHGPVM